MAWRDRLRRRAAGPDSAGRPRRAEPAASGGPSGDGRDRSAPGGPGPSVPADWDGGWRRAAPAELTVARTPLGVSDGLAFRAGLASWQNPSFDAGLGHALLPTAPTGLVRGVTPPAAPQPTRTGRGPLLLRALRPEGADGPGAGTTDTGALSAGSADRPARLPAATRTPTAGRPGPEPSAVQRAAARPFAEGSSRSGGGAADAGSGAEQAVERRGGNSIAEPRRSGNAPRARGITSSDPLAALAPPRTPAGGRPVEPGTGPVVTPSGTGRPPAPAHIPLVRRVSVVRGAVADAAAAGFAAAGRAHRPSPGGRVARTPSGTPGRGSGRPSSSPATGPESRTSAGPAVQRAATGTAGRGDGGPGAPRALGADVSRRPARIRPVGPLPTVARRPAGPVRRLPALRPAATPAPDSSTTPPAPDVTSTRASQADTTTGTPPADPAPRTAPRPRSRAPLGAPLGELPSTSSPLTNDTATSSDAPGPVLPVVQRRSESAAATPAPTAGGAKGTG
ncbi:hypothetical protein ACFVW8_25350, partial [Streptomyces sp. NPDC058221]